MKKGQVCLLLLLLALCGLNAQSISQYEYWTDDDYAARSVVDASVNEITLSISTETLGAGVHFLNFRAQRDDGIWGDFCRYMYYIPALSNSVSGSLSLEYWLDDANGESKKEEVDNNDIALTLDISQLKAGVHFFNCTPISSTSGRGNSERYMFYVPFAFEQATVAAVTGYEYWFDDDFATLVKKEATAGEQLLAMSLEGLTGGVHFFNCRAMNERGEYGCPVREMFYVPDSKTSSDAKLASYEYWIDDDYTNCVKGSSANAEQAFSIDISQLSSGVHYFNYCAKDDKDRRGYVTRNMFYIARANDKPTTEQIEYEYWIDDDTDNKVTGKDTTGEMVFNIDVSGLSEGNHTFSFRAKDVLEQWGDTFVEAFEIFDVSVGDVNKDCIVDIADAVCIVNHVVGKETSTFIEAAADVNGDGVVDIADAVKIVNFVVGKVETLSREQKVEEKQEAQ